VVQESWWNSEGVFLLVWVFLGTIALSLIVERSRFRRFVPGPILVILIPGALANLGLIPSQSAVYDIIIHFAVPVGVTLLLLRADVREILRSTGAMLPLFLLAGAGMFIALLIVDSFMQFENEEALGALLVALFVGSVVNVVATSQVLLVDQTVLAGVIAANTLVAPVYLAIIMVLMRSDRIGRLVGAAPGSSAGDFKSPTTPEKITDTNGMRPPLGELMAVLYALGIFISVEALVGVLGTESYAILIVTLVAVAVPNLMPRIRHSIRGDREIGMISMFLFLSALAAQIDLGALGYASVMIMIWMAVSLLINIPVLIGVGRIFKADPHLIFLASLAGVGGPTSTAAVAASQGREDLVTPGILCALLGVVISTFVGVAAYYVFGW
jgi:uncharacterized membrane protein